MFKHKSIIYSSLLFITLSFVALQFSSCERNRCKTRGTVCLNEGTCYDGSCLCTSGFEGDSCQYPMNKKFASKFGGLFIKNNSIVPDADTITVVVDTPSNISIRWSHLRIKNVLFKGNVDGNEILVPAMLGADGFTYKGSGSLNQDVFTLSMRADSIVAGISLKGYGYTFSGNRTK